MKEAHQEEERQSLLSNAPTGKVKIEDDDDPARTTLTCTTSKQLIKIATITALATTFATCGYVSEREKLSLSSSELGHGRYQKGGDAGDDFSRKPSSSYAKSARLGGRWSSSRDDDEDDDRYSSRRSSSRGRDDFDDDRRG